MMIWRRIKMEIISIKRGEKEELMSTSRYVTGNADVEIKMEGKRIKMDVPYTLEYVTNENSTGDEFLNDCTINIDGIESDEDDIDFDAIAEEIRKKIMEG